MGLRTNYNYNLGFLLKKAKTMEETNRSDAALKIYRRILYVDERTGKMNLYTIIKYSVVCRPYLKNKTVLIIFLIDF
jgi:hypothetical protein